MGKATATGHSRIEERTETDAEEAERISLTIENPAETSGPEPRRFWERRAAGEPDATEPLSLSAPAPKITDPLRLKWLFREIGRLLFFFRARAVQPQTPQEAQGLASVWLFSDEEQAECSTAAVNALNSLPLKIPGINEASAVGEAVGTIGALFARKLSAEQQMIAAVRNPSVTTDGLQRFPQPGEMRAEPSQSA